MKNSKTTVTTIHQKLKNLGIPLSGHYSDLYVEVTPDTQKIINDYEFKNNVTKFISEIDGKLMFDIPLANDDFFKGAL
jgi:hypothetical protein